MEKNFYLRNSQNHTSLRASRDTYKCPYRTEKKKKITTDFHRKVVFKHF